MKRRIFVLDAFTNGHEAASVFIQRQSWPADDCEIIFCGNHMRVLKRLSQGPGYAVIPVKNSIVGEVSDVVKKLSELRDVGYNLSIVDEFDLQVNHCLMAQQDVQRPEELERILSHEKAIEQCGLFLDRIGVTPDRRSKKDSTGNAAKVVSRLAPGTRFGAIAPKAAASEYGLKILSEKIQDVADNRTKFLLLENKAEVEPKTVGIIGITGEFGQLLKYFFEQLGCRVIGSGRRRPTEFNNRQVVEQSDVVIFSIKPVEDAPSVIRSVIPFTREDQLLMDVTSIKQPAVNAMLGGRSQVVGLHPMFRPDVSFDGQTVVVCPARLTLPHWKTWVVNMLSAMGATLKWSTSAEHDKYMTAVQVIPHLGNLVSALLITESGISVSESLSFTSPFYRIMFALMGRLVSQTPDLYTSIVMENPETAVILEQRIKIEQFLLEMIRKKDRASFEQLFVRAHEHFGKSVTKEANELFMRLIGVLSTLYGKNSVILEFTKTNDHPGLLKRILQVFDDQQINLTGINSVFLYGHRLQFTISFQQSRFSDSVRKALEEIENWKEPKVTVIES